MDFHSGVRQVNCCTVLWRPEDRGRQPRWTFFCKVTENLMIQQYIWSLQRYLHINNWRWRREERLARASGGDGRGGDAGWRYWEGKYFDNHLGSTIWEGDYFDKHPNIVVVVDTDDFFLQWSQSFYCRRHFYRCHSRNLLPQTRASTTRAPTTQNLW